MRQCAADVVEGFGHGEVVGSQCLSLEEKDLVEMDNGLGVLFVVKIVDASLEGFGPSTCSFVVFFVMVVVAALIVVFGGGNSGSGMGALLDIVVVFIVVGAVRPRKQAQKLFLLAEGLDFGFYAYSNINFLAQACSRLAISLF